MAYGVATNNIFALLDEENEDPQALASKPVEHDETSQAKKEPTPKAKEVPKTAVASNVEARMRGLSTAEGPGRGRGRGPPRGGNGGRGRGGYDRPAMENESFDAGNGPAANRGRSSRGGRDGGRGGRGGRGPREGPDGRPIRRQYDRRDGTGRGSETEKRHGAGRGNWGAEGDEIKEEAQAVPATDEAKPAVEEPAAEEEAAPPTPAPAPEEEEKEMTLDEYEKLIKEKNTNLNKAPPAKSAQADPKEFAGMTAYTRKDLGDADEEENDLELKNKKQIGGRKSGATVKELKTKEVLVPSFRVGDDGGFSGERGGRRSGRGGRGGDRGDGGRGRGPPRGDRPPREDRSPHEREDRPPRQYGGPRMGGRGSAAPAINDAHAFPTLGN